MITVCQHKLAHLHVISTFGSDDSQLKILICCLCLFKDIIVWYRVCVLQNGVVDDTVDFLPASLVFTRIRYPGASVQNPALGFLSGYSVLSLPVVIVYPPASQQYCAL